VESHQVVDACGCACVRAGEQQNEVATGAKKMPKMPNEDKNILVNKRGGTKIHNKSIDA